MLKYLVTGRWGPGGVAARFVHGTRRETAASRAAIAGAWQRVGADPRVKLFDGPMCRLEAFAVEHSGALRLDLSPTSYRVFLGTNLHGPRDLPIETLANPLGVSPALQTSDGFLLFGRRNASVAYYPHRLHPFSGSLEPPPDERALDIFSECRRELAEELNLAAGDVTDLLLLGIVEDTQIRHPELILHARTTLDRAGLERRLDPMEHAGIHAVPANREGVAAALEDASFTPVARAALTLSAELRGWA